MSASPFRRLARGLAPLLAAFVAVLAHAQDPAASPPAKLSLAVGAVKVTPALEATLAQRGQVLELGRVQQSLDPQLTAAFQASRKFELVARSDLKDVLLEQDLSGEDLHEILQGFLKHLKEDGLNERLRYLTHTLDKPSRRVAFDFAAMLSACDGEVAEEELGMLGTIAKAFDIPEKEAQQRFDEICELVLEE